MNSLCIQVAELNSSDFAGLLVGSLVGKGITADLRTERDNQQVIVAWGKGNDHIEITVCNDNKETVVWKRGVRVVNLTSKDVSTLLNKKTRADQIYNLLWPQFMTSAA